RLADGPGVWRASLEEAANSVLNPVTMQIVAVGIEPALGALDMAAGFCDHAPKPRRMVHLDQMRHFMRGEIVQYVRRRKDQPPGKRQRSGRGAGTPAARLIADRHPLDPNAELLRIGQRRLLQILARF